MPDDCYSLRSRRPSDSRTFPHCPLRAEVDQVGPDWCNQHSIRDALMCNGSHPLQDLAAIRWYRDLGVTHGVDAQGVDAVAGPAPSSPSSKLSYGQLFGGIAHMPSALGHMDAVLRHTVQSRNPETEGRQTPSSTPSCGASDSDTDSHRACHDHRTDTLGVYASVASIPIVSASIVDWPPL